MRTWVIRACEEGDYRRAKRAAHDERTALQPPTEDLQHRAAQQAATVADARTRMRDTRHHRTATAIRNLADHAVGTVSTATPEQRRTAVDSQPSMETLTGKHLARQSVAATAPGVEPLAAIKEPETVAEALGAMDSTYRGMLIRAAGRDADPAAKQARKQAAATIDLWWQRMPSGIRRTIDFLVDAWRREHPTVTDAATATRRVLMLIPHLCPNRSGAQSLAVALRHRSH